MRQQLFVPQSFVVEMAQQDWIESVYSLTTLPAPLSGKNGLITGSAVSSLSQGKKRKRSEIATAIDGESINLYSVWRAQDQQVIKGTFSHVLG